jgi:DNA polymerase III epsilon subunit-like protein
MRFLVFDTETTGLPKTRYINPFALEEWPHIVQLSYIVYDTETNDIVDSKDYIIKLPHYVLIPEESSKIHGITNDISAEKGCFIEDILNEFFYQLRSCDAVIGHNIEFDINIVKVELLRIINGGNETSSQLKLYKKDLHFLTHFNNVICTLKDSIAFCNIQSIDKRGKPYLKYPKLSELHEKLFNKTPSNLHNSFNDVLVTLRCFMKLKHSTDLYSSSDAFKSHCDELGIF